jgi:hypothetical protein
MAKPKTTTEKPEAVASAEPTKTAAAAKVYDEATEIAYAEYERTGSAAACQKAADRALAFYLAHR